MKLLSTLVISALALTDDEMAAFKCRDASYAQYDMVDTNGGTEVNEQASSKYSFRVRINRENCSNQNWREMTID